MGVLLLNERNYTGTPVVANPVGTATDDLTTIQIGSTIYGIEGGGGGGGIVETLFEGNVSTNKWAEPLIFTGFNLSDYSVLYIHAVLQGTNKAWEISVPLIPACTASGAGSAQIEGQAYDGYVDDTYYMFVSTGYSLAVTKIQGLRQGGGGGNVDDVYVNGTSVLDSDKIAQITSYKEVTQAEYDALPASKLTDNILYCIKDKATADTTVAPIIYSEEEREIGVWTDGKPLYQKTIYLGPITKDTNWHYLPHGINNIDKIVLCEGCIAEVNNTVFAPIPNYRPGYTMGICIEINQTNIGYMQNWLDSPSDQTYITLQYTKTTDQPGSGKWAPSGVPAVHYSENEHVIGTWIDGDTLYEKTLSFTTGIANTYFQISHNIQNAKDVWIESGYVKGLTEILTLAPYRSGNDNDVFIGLINRTSESFDYKVGSEGTNCPAYVTLRYTKSTS